MQVCTFFVFIGGNVKKIVKIDTFAKTKLSHNSKYLAFFFHKCLNLIIIIAQYQLANLSGVTNCMFS